MSGFRQEIDALDRMAAQLRAASPAQGSPDWMQMRAAEVASETLAVETPHAVEFARAKFTEKLHDAERRASIQDAKRPFAAAKKTKAQQHAENEVRTYRAILSDLDRPARDRNPVINMDLETMFKAAQGRRA